MFRGINVVNIDPKGRFSMPTKYRHRLIEESQGHMIMTVDTDELCLQLYTLPRWEVVEQKLQGLPSFNPAARRIQRLLIGHASEVEMDGHGRLLLPTVLRELVSLDKHLVLIGQGHRFELWSQENWDKERDAWMREGVMKKGELVNMEDLSL